MLRAEEKSPASEVAVIHIDASKASGAVNRMVFGHNIEAGDSSFQVPGADKPLSWLFRSIRSGDGVWDIHGQRPVPQVVSAARDIGMSVLRYPGGCEVHNWDWRMTVGPIRSRGSIAVAPAGTTGDWQFGLDEYLVLCRAIGAEPIITVSDYAFDIDELARNAGELVEYLNAPATPTHPWAMKRKEWGHPEPYGVKWFELGNETNHGNHGRRPYKRYSPQEYVDYALKTAAAMRTVDPTIKLGVVLAPGSMLDIDRDWNKQVLKSTGSIADFVIVHFYIPSWSGQIALDPAGESNLMDACMAVSEQLEYRIKEHHRVIREICGRDLPLAVTEFNAGLLGKNPPYRFSHGAGLEVADLLRVFLKPENGILMANYWQFINGYWGLLQTDEAHPENPHLVQRPAFYPYEMWGRHFGTCWVPVRVESPVKTFASNTPRVMNASGTEYVPRKLLRTIGFEGNWKFNDLEELGVVAQKEKGNGVTMEFNTYEAYAHPLVALFSLDGAKVPTDSFLRLSYEARFVPMGLSEKPVCFSLFLTAFPGMDAEIMGAQQHGAKEPEWQTFSQTYFPTANVRKVGMFARLEAGGRKVSGRLEVRNLRIDAWSNDIFPAYPLVTSAASLSDDRSRLFVMVFNKSDSRSINIRIDLDGFDADGGRKWELSGEFLSFDKVTGPTDGGEVAVQNRTAQATLPPRSMTAFEFVKRVEK